MMTWGEIEGTPFRLDASDMTLGDGGPVFKVRRMCHQLRSNIKVIYCHSSVLVSRYLQMPEVPYRDKLAQEMTDTIGKRYRERRQKAVQQAESLHT